MRPEKHAIRDLEKQLETASPEVAAATERVTLGLKALVLNEGDRLAARKATSLLAKDIAALEDITGAVKRGNEH